MQLPALRLCLVTHPEARNRDPNHRFIEQSIAGGVTSVQLRLKNHSLSVMRDTANELLSLLRPRNIPLIINDNVELAKETDADGIHLGQSDLCPTEARRILGPNKIIGLSIETRAQLLAANELNCIDYVAASAIFQSTTKTNCKTIWGLDGLQTMKKIAQHPLIAIGGIGLNNVHDVMLHGADGVAVISAIYDHPNPCLAAQSLRENMRID